MDRHAKKFETGGATAEEVVRRYWGFPSLRPLQGRAIRAGLEDRDSLVVMPTGGGKSLCYQVPPLVHSDLTLVISPLISLMKDQVDGLRALGIAARQIDSTRTEEEKRITADEARRGELRLLFVSPERLAMPSFLDFLDTAGVGRIAVDEAHCISHWGHDFRPDYRHLSALRRRFPQASIHAYTATATPRVSDDIQTQLELRDPVVLIGDFDRPNLTYRVVPRRNRLSQVTRILERHKGEGGIIYCIRRRDVDTLAEALGKRGIAALPYHAGLDQEERRTAQEAFSTERCEVIVATVAFGMGIDRSNIRFVIHGAMPKSIEHYQQETGRAGRDGLEAECVLLYSGADFVLWKSIIERSATEFEGDPSTTRAAIGHLEEMSRYARGSACRHRALVGYFGQRYEGDDCAACDLCLGETETVAGATVIAQKILSCVARTGERFGVGYVVSVLRGDDNERIVRDGHDGLSTWGLLAEHPAIELRDWTYQLLGQGVLEQVGGEYPIVRLNPAAREVMRGEREVRLVEVPRPKKRDRRSGRDASASWEGVDRELFESLRQLRMELAGARGVPAYVVFGDATLRELARTQPTSLTEMADIYGIGEAKLKDPAPTFLQAILDYRAAGQVERSGTESQIEI